VIVDWGESALLTSLLVSMLQGVVPWFLKTHKPLISYRFVQVCALFNFGLISFSFLSLIKAFASSDFNLSAVAMNSQAGEFWFYKIGATWGNHEGSMLFWVWILASYQMVFTLGQKSLPIPVKTIFLTFLGLIVASFIAFVFFTSNPFDRFPFPAKQGLGLHPLLQDPAMLYHPPTLYLGYVGFTIPFVFALVALFEKKCDAEWSQWVQPWALFSWAFLTLGITLGSWWAYYELGWGGWWFWDPVENASLLPWLLGTAFIHTLHVLRKKEAQKSWVLLLALLTFSMCLFGTFLVRSGVLTSVHAFAHDIKRGFFILTLMGVLLIPSFLFYLARLPFFQSSVHPFSLFSRDGMITLQNCAMGLFTLIILAGTLYPLIAPVMVSPRYFNEILIPLSLPFLFLMGLVPASNWQSASLISLLRKQHGAVTVSFLGSVIGLYLLSASQILLLGILSAGVWILLTTGTSYFQKIRATKDHGMSLAHVGLAIVLLGMSVDVLFQQEKVFSVAVRERFSFAGYDFQFADLERVRTETYMAERGIVKIFKEKDLKETVYPEKRFYLTQRLLTTEVSLYHRGLSQYYIILGGVEPGGKRILKIYYHPFVSLIWIGGIVMFLGGMLSWFRLCFKR
jgi:cytochrome c-type biogenesis protein CcmF